MKEQLQQELPKKPSEIAEVRSPYEYNLRAEALARQHRAEHGATPSFLDSIMNYPPRTESLPPQGIIYSKN